MAEVRERETSLVPVSSFPCVLQEHLICYRNHTFFENLQQNQRTLPGNTRLKNSVLVAPTIHYWIRVKTLAYVVAWKMTINHHINLLNLNKKERL